jgi:hypothetical protein
MPSIRAWENASATTGNLKIANTAKISPRATKVTLAAARSISSTKKPSHGIMFNNSTTSNVFMTP